MKNVSDGESGLLRPLKDYVATYETYSSRMTDAAQNQFISYLKEHYGNDVMFRGMTLEVEDLEMIQRNGLKANDRFSHGIFNWSADADVGVRFVTGGLTVRRLSGILVLLVMRKPSRIRTIDRLERALAPGEVVTGLGVNNRHFHSGAIPRSLLTEILVFDPRAAQNEFPFAVIR